jgi:hypothetical protein
MQEKREEREKLMYKTRKGWVRQNPVGKSYQPAVRSYIYGKGKM